MTRLQKIQIAQSETREAINNLLNTDDRTDAQNADLRTLTAKMAETETEYRAALAAEGDSEREAREAAQAAGVDPEMRERLELRGRSTLTAFLLAALSGRMPDGAEAEFAAAHHAPAGHVPIDLFESDRPRETRAATPAASTGTGTTVAPVQPFVYSPSIASRLGIEMPSVPSGSYSEMTITTAQPAGARTKGADATDTAGALTPITAAPRSISARMSVTLEDVAAIGAANFEAALRANVSMALSAEVDDQIVNGNGTAPNIDGLLNQLTAVGASTAIAAFDDFVALVAGRVDGLWAGGTPDIAMVVNPETYRLAARTFRGAAADGGPVFTASTYLRETSGAFFCNERMPAKTSHVASAIAYRMGRTGLRTACLPTWGTISIDDIYTLSRSGQRAFTVHALVGSKLLIVQPDAYVEASVRISS